jgi:hypothetical protein
MLALEIIGAYAIVGPLWARSQAVRLQRAVKVGADYRQAWFKEHGSPAYSQVRQYKSRDPWFFTRNKSTAFDLRLALAFHVTFWPAFAVGRAGSKIVGWTIKPIAKEREAVRKLREEAESYTPVLANPNTTKDERILITKLVRSLEAQAKEREL